MTVPRGIPLINLDLYGPDETRPPRRKRPRRYITEAQGARLVQILVHADNLAPAATTDAGVKRVEQYIKPFVADELRKLMTEWDLL